MISIIMKIFDAVCNESDAIYIYRNYITNNGCAETKPSANCKFNNFSKLFPPISRIFTHSTRKTLQRKPRFPERVRPFLF